MSLSRYLVIASLLTAGASAPLHADELADLSQTICKRGVECARPMLEEMRAQVPPEMQAMVEQSITGAYCNNQYWGQASEEVDAEQYEAVVRCFRAWSKASCDYFVGDNDLMSLPECAPLAEME